MSEIRPLSYITPAASRTLSGGLLTSQTSTGSIGAWATPQAISVLDPTKTYTTAELIDTYNAAVWGLYNSGALVTEPLIGFNEMSYGVDIQVNGGTALQYRYGSNTCKVSTILSDLNTLLTGTGVLFTLFQRKHVLMRVPNGVTLTFSDPPNTIDGTGLRFLRKLLGSTLGATVTGPIVLRGPELDAPFIGVYPAPEGVTNLRATTITSSSITLEWDPSPTAGIRYLVTRSGSTQKNYTTTTSWTFTGLAQTTAYTFRVRTLTDNAISVENNSFSVTTATIFVPVPDLTSVTAGQDTITVEAASQTLPSQVVNIVITVEDENAIPIGVERLYAPTETSMVVTGLTPGVLYYIRARYRLNDGTDGAFSSPVSARTYIPAPDLIDAGSTTTSFTVSWTPPTYPYKIRIEDINSSTINPISPEEMEASIGSYTFNNLSENTTYSISARYGIDYTNFDGPTTTINITTATTPSPLLFGPIVDGKQYNNRFSIYGNDSRNFPTIFGFRVPASSTMIGYAFNKVSFPKINTTFEGICGTLSSVNPYGDGQLIVKVYDSNPYTGGTLLAQSQIVVVINKNSELANGTLATQFPNIYEAYLYEPGTSTSKTIIMSAGMYILFATRYTPPTAANNYTDGIYSGELSFLTFDGNYSPLISIQDVPMNYDNGTPTLIDSSTYSFGPNYYTGTNSSALCNFELA